MRTSVSLVVAALTPVALALLPLASAHGYPVFGTVGTWWLFSALVLVTATVVCERVFPWRGAADACIRIAVTAFAIVVFCGGVLGTLGWLSPAPYLALLTAVSVAALWLTPALADRRQPAAPGFLEALASQPRLVIAVALGAAMTALLTADGLTHSPLTAYDSLSYHLFFPARWVQEHALSIIATPFSDEAQAYAPGNGELYFAWLMLPFHGDLLARIGQVPFLLLIMLALYGLGRQAGAPPAHAIYPAVFCVGSRLVVEQAVGADVDLVCWGLFLTSLYLGLVALETDERRDWVIWGVGLGLHWGTKYVSLVYSPILFAIPFVRGVRPRALWSLAGILAFGFSWYLRNWIVAGSPLYPSSLAVGGIAIAQGAFNRSAMVNSLFHTTDFTLFPVLVAHAMGVTLSLAWIVLVGLGVWGMVRKAARWPAFFLLCVPLAMVLFYWFGVPDNIDSRFLLPAAILALVPLAFVFDVFDSARWRATVHAIYGAVLVWTFVGVNAELPVALPGYMGGWLSMSGLIGRLLMPVFGPLLVVFGGVSLLVRRWRHGWLAITALMAFAPVPLASLANGMCAPQKCDYLQLTSIYLRDSFLEAWQWVSEHAATDATFAYTGNNVPYPLVGPRLTNRVVYVNIDRHVHWRFHDYDRAARTRSGPPDPAALASRSGVLQPVAETGGPFDAVRPRYARMEGDRVAWARNLRVLGIDHLFISALSAYEIDNVWHNGAGFPIEDEWAKADPEAFVLVYENPQVRIYRFTVR